MPVHFFTIVARNYLAHALVLGDSVKRTHSAAEFSIVLLDDTNHELAGMLSERGFGVIYPEQLAIPEFRQFVFKYNVTEASTAVKPSVIRHLFDAGANKVVYLDPDILVYRRFDELLSLLDEFSIVLTPHICSPAGDNVYPGDRNCLQSGVYNLGFIALRNDGNARSFVSWWEQKLSQQCIEELALGLFVDQKWIDLVPACFAGVHVFRNHAYNIAYWNLHERTLFEEAGRWWVSPANVQVAFMHFSGIDFSDLNSLFKYAARNPLDDSWTKATSTLESRPDLKPHFERYRSLVLEAGHERFWSIPYAFSVYDNGEGVSQLERRIYLSNGKWQNAGIDPFATGPQTFWEACRKAGVRKRNAEKSLPDTASALTSKFRAQIGFLRFCIWMILRLVGPDMYLKAAKFVRYQLLPINHGFLVHGPKGPKRSENSLVRHEPDSPKDNSSNQEAPSPGAQVLVK